ncbi:MAG: cation-efflux pump [Legionella sp.]|nr:MAG: cation-efflux pump [Legionella sp.]
MAHHRYHQAKHITLIGAGVNVLLGIVKVLGGFIFYSHGLIADGLHSFSDLFTDTMVLFASKYGSQDADDEHPYGHQRIETAATLLLALLLILTGIGIAWDSFGHILHQSVETPSKFALPIAFFSIVANEALFYITKRVGQRIQSPLILANAWHHRSDSASSGIVLLGILGSLFGLPFLDPLAAILVGGLIIKMGIDYGWDSVKELVDTGVVPEQIAEIKQIINQVDGVCKIHQLRTRKMGSDILIDVHILVSPCISVSEGHHIAQSVHASLTRVMHQVKDVTVHVDPEDDEVFAPSRDLPSRATLENTLLNRWSERFPHIQTYTLHYLDGKITIDILLDEQFDQGTELSDMIRQDLSTHPKIVTICLLKKKGKL